MSGITPSLLVPNHAMTAAEMAAINRYGVLARGSRSTSSSTTTTIIGVLRIDNVPLLSGRQYRFHTCGLNLVSSVAADDIAATIRWNAAGAATTGSPIVPGAQVRSRMPGGGAGTPILAVNALWIAGTGTYSFLLCVARAAGSGNVNIFGDANTPIDMWLEDAGLDPGDTGIDI